MSNAAYARASRRQRSASVQQPVRTRGQLSLHGDRCCIRDTLTVAPLPRTDWTGKRCSGTKLATAAVVFIREQRSVEKLCFRVRAEKWEKERRSAAVDTSWGCCGVCLLSASHDGGVCGGVRELVLGFLGSRCVCVFPVRAYLTGKPIRSGVLGGHRRLRNRCFSSSAMFMIRARCTLLVSRAFFTGLF